MALLKKLKNVASKVVKATVVNPTKAAAKVVTNTAKSTANVTKATAQLVTGKTTAAKATLTKAAKQSGAAVVNSVQGKQLQTTARAIKENPQKAQAIGKVMTAVGGAVAATGVGAAVGGAISAAGVGLTTAGRVAEAKQNKDKQGVGAALLEGVAGAANSTNNMNLSGFLGKATDTLNKTNAALQSGAAVVNTLQSLNPSRGAQKNTLVVNNEVSPINAAKEQIINGVPPIKNSNTMIENLKVWLTKPVVWVVAAALGVVCFLFMRKKSRFRR